MSSEKDLPFTEQNFASDKREKKQLLSNIHFAPLQISSFQIMADTWFYKTVLNIKVLGWFSYGQPTNIS